MENLERSQFVVLTGHLDDRPLPDLIRTLRAQRKSGRLQIEYADAPGTFFFEEGQLVDAQLGSLRGVEALYAALELRGGSFNFNPLVRPPERSIDRQGQKFVWDLIETPRRNNVAELRVAGRELPDANASPLDLPPAPAPAQLPPAPQQALVRLEPTAAAALTAPLEARLTAVEGAIDEAARRFSRERLVYGVVISFLVGLTVVTALQAIYGPFFSSRARANELASAQLQQTDAARPAGDAKSGDAATKTPITAETSAATDAKNEPRKSDTAPARGAAAQTAGGASNPDAAAKQRRGAQVAAPARSAQSSAQSSATLTQSSSSTPAPTPSSQSAPRGAKKGGAAAGGYVVRVLMEVKDGHVTDARVLDPRPGAEAYEALALRLARQRRYPDNFTGGDTWKIRVKP